jgi:hypothetical protein
MPKKPVITPEQIEAGVQKNANEYNARVEALRALHADGSYNPAVDPTILSKAAAEAGRGATPLPSLTPSVNNEFDVRLASRDPQAEAMAKANGKRVGGRREAKNEEGEAEESGAGDARVEARDTPFRQQARPQSPFAQPGNSHSASPVWVEQVYEAETEEAVRALVPAGAKAVELRQVWKATALVRVTPS